MRFLYFVIIASRAQVKKLKFREEIKNMENDNGHSFLTEDLGQTNIMLEKTSL